MSNIKDKKVPNVPNLRFEEFDSEWVEKELKSISTRVQRRNKNNETKLPLTISAQFGLIDQANFFDRQIASKDMSNYYLLYNGEFAYNKSYSNGYPWGTVKRLDLYDKGALSSLYICFKPLESICSSFLVQYYETTKWYKGISDIAGEGARNHGLLNMSVTDFFNTKHFIPSYVEQEKIAKFLTLIDERIATQNKIIEDLKKLRDGIRNSIFSSNIGNVCVLKKLITPVNERNKNGLITNVLSVSNRLGFIKQTDQFEDREVASNDKNNYKIVKFNQFGYNPARINVGSIARLKKYDVGIVSPMYLCFEANNSSLDSEYLEHFINTKNFTVQVKQKLEGSVRLCLTYDALEQIKIPLVNLCEQKQIGENLNLIDKKIENETLFLDKLNYEKSFLLQNLFI